MITTNRTTLRATATFGRRAPRPSRYESPSTYGLGDGMSSHAPLDLTPHWDWRNPLNIIPFTLLAIILFGIIGVLIG
jgi:hypothetical protein